MKKLFLFSFALFLLLTTSNFAQMMQDVSPDLRATNNDGPMAMWDVKFNYDLTVNGALGNAGGVYIPTLQRFWVSRWAATLIKVYNTSGVAVDSFNLATTGTRGMAWDGQYIYCSQNNNTLQKIDPVTRTAVGTITIAATVPNGARYVAFDPTANSGAGGFWVGNWTAPNLNFYLISRTGAVLRTVTNATTGVYGIAFDNMSTGGPFLWVWGQGSGAGFPQIIQQMNVATGLYTGVQHDVKTDVGIAQPASGIAGALFVTDQLYPGKVTLGGVMQGTPDRLFGYELGNVIPVELTAFTANANGNSVVLNWSTATEVNNRGFEIQKKSVDGQFTTIAFVNGKGTTTEAQNYMFTDKTNSGKYSYRLKQVDFNGFYSYSKTVETQVNPSEFELSNNYPNPFNPNTKISFALSVDSKVSLKVFNLLGQEVASLVNGNLTAGNHEVNFDASNLSTGVYMYKIEANGFDGQNFTSVKKMILNK